MTKRSATPYPRHYALPARRWLRVSLLVVLASLAVPAADAPAVVVAPSVSPAVESGSPIDGMQLARTAGDRVRKEPREPLRGSSAMIGGGSSADVHGGTSVDKGTAATHKMGKSPQDKAAEHEKKQDDIEAARRAAAEAKNSAAFPPEKEEKE